MVVTSNKFFSGSCDRMEKSMMIKITAVVVVIIIVVAAAAVMISGDDDDDSSGTSINSTLMLRGNADNNYTIDSRDMEVVDDIISGKKSLSEYPLADVNGDGRVDDTDKSILQDMIDRKTGTTVYAIALDRLGNETTVPVQYPLRNIVTYATNMDMPVIYSGGSPYVAGYFKLSYTNAQSIVNDSAVDLKGNQRQISDAAWANFTKLDADLTAQGGVGAFLADYSGIAQITEKRADDLKAAGIPFLAYKSADANIECDVVVTLSYLFGTETETIGQKYAELRDKVSNEISSKIGGYTEAQKTTFIAFNMYTYICAKDSTYSSTGIAAGGIYYSDVNQDFYEKYCKGKSNSTNMTSVEALSNYKDVGVLLNYRSIDWLNTQDEIDSEIVSTWDHVNSKGTKTSEYFSGFEDKLIYINNLLPGSARMAYTAAALYPELFSYEWADSILQECIDAGMPSVSGHTVDQLIPYFDNTKYQEARS